MEVQTQEQRRASSSWDRLRETFGSDPDQWPQKDRGAAKYLAAVRKTPARIHNCGLGPALAFLRSHNQKDVAEDLSALTLELLGRTGESDLIAALRDETSGAFLFTATEEALAVLPWLMWYLQGYGVRPEEEPDDTATDGQSA